MGLKLWMRSLASRPMQRIQNVFDTQPDSSDAGACGWGMRLRQEASTPPFLPGSPTSSASTGISGYPGRPAGQRNAHRFLLELSCVPDHPVSFLAPAWTPGVPRAKPPEIHQTPDKAATPTIEARGHAGYLVARLAPIPLLPSCNKIPGLYITENCATHTRK